MCVNKIGSLPNLLVWCTSPALFWHFDSVAFEMCGLLYKIMSSLIVGHKQDFKIAHVMALRFICGDVFLYVCWLVPVCDKCNAMVLTMH